MSVNSVRRLANSVAASPKKSPGAAGLGTAMKCYKALFVASETADANLSQVTIGSETFRWVPRLSSAWSTAPSAGTVLLIGSLGGSFIILGIQLGDITLAGS